ncbi:MAG: hydroxyacylglutathione hydrolase [Silicimonas sp.]|nr:hydroxyacylglutathione hydrolase [Silicimonas sp.]
MAFEIVTVPCLSDNYAFLLVKGQRAAVVDIPEAAPILAEVAKRELTVTDILITHHHADHIQGLADLLAGVGGSVRVIGSSIDPHRLPDLDLSVGQGDSFNLLDSEVRVMDVSGHTIGHIAYYVPEAHAVFTADSLMALGCGRVFEGTMEHMWESLTKLAALPPDTIVCSGHEYTETNARFALTIEPENPELQARVQKIADARSRGEATVPSLLSDELATNPFLRAGLAEVKSALNMEHESDATVFGEIRRRKDSF